ncbi:hypothetical protein ACL02U_22310 [Streptomyces sp. MS06]|uniref:hypothetical protein n=1 Tax=Streptomyces sp. MS06 TaxID=3385974 RepID=UPI00399F95DE
MNDGLDDRGPAGLDPDELAVRRLLHEAVREMEPRDGSLEHLRRAVPARRARKRQAVVGMAAAALFVGTAVPALVHVSRSAGSEPDPFMAGSSSQAQGGTSQGKDPGEPKDTVGTDTRRTPEPTDRHRPQRTPAADPGSTSPSADPTAAAATPAVCTSAQLGRVTATAEVPDAAGIVYGTFRVSNVSDGECTVGAAGTVAFVARGAADATRITVVRHTAGDAAADLPDPSLFVPRVSLAPGSSYTVEFAWVPARTCQAGSGGGTSGGGAASGGTASPAPSPSKDADSGSTGTGTGAGGGTGTGTSTQPATADGTADGSVVVSHTPDAGEPTASVTVPNACAGTIYRTGLLTAP